MKRTAGPSTDAQGRLLATNPACWYKETCPQADQAAHYASYSHPCKYGEKCYRKNPDHFERYVYVVLRPQRCLMHCLYRRFNHPWDPLPLPPPPPPPPAEEEENEDDEEREEREREEQREREHALNSAIDALKKTCATLFFAPSLLCDVGSSEICSPLLSFQRHTQSIPFITTLLAYHYAPAQDTRQGRMVEEDPR